MTDKIIDEVMELVADLENAVYQSAATGLGASEVFSLNRAILTKLREVLERKPLSDQKILDAWYGCGIGATYDIAPSQDDIDWCRAIERAHNIGDK